MPPNRGNARGHWAVNYRAQRDYYNRLDNLQLIGFLPRLPAEPMGLVRLDVVAVLARRNDSDNLVARCKWPIDWLVSRRYLKSDDPSVLDWPMMPEKRVSRKEAPRLTFTITDMVRYFLRRPEGSP